MGWLIASIASGLMSIACIAATIENKSMGLPWEMNIAPDIFILILTAVFVKKYRGRKTGKSARIKLGERRDRNKKLPRQRLRRNTSPYKITSEIIPNELPQHVIDDMRSSYTKENIQNDLRILQESLDIIEMTENIETFFSRCYVALRSVCTLEQAKKSGIHVEVSDDLPELILDIKDKMKPIVLTKSYKK